MVTVVLPLPSPQSSELVTGGDRMALSLIAMTTLSGAGPSTMKPFGTGEIGAGKGMSSLGPPLQAAPAALPGPPWVPRRKPVASASAPAHETNVRTKWPAPHDVMRAGHYLAAVRIAMNQSTKPADDANTNGVSTGQTDRICGRGRCA